MAFYYELTGPTCAGKSTLLRHDPRVSVKPQTIKFISGIIFVLFNSPRGFVWLLRHCFKSDRSAYHRLRVFVNVFAKFSTYLRYSRQKKHLIVDEGVSHIPFILMLSNADIDEFLTIFSFVIKNIEIEFVRIESALLESRIISRGHKRIRNQSDLVFFCREPH